MVGVYGCNCCDEVVHDAVHEGGFVGAVSDVFGAFDAEDGVARDEVGVLDVVVEDAWLGGGGWVWVREVFGGFKLEYGAACHEGRE